MEIVIATWNKLKFTRMATGLEQTDLAITPLAEHIEDVSETEATFGGNAQLKVDAVRASDSHSIIVGEDSGLSIDMLGGFPGVKTARFMQGTDDDRAKKVMELLQGKPLHQRKATFHSAIVVSFPDGTQVECGGEMHGWIATKRVEGKGYGGIFLLSNHLVLAEQPTNGYKVFDHQRQALFEARQAIQDWLISQ